MAIPENNLVYDQMLNKQKMTDIVPKESFKDEYEDFIKDGTELVGDYIVEDALDEMTNLGISATIFDGEKPSIAEMLYNNRFHNSYVYNIRNDEFKKVANTKGAYDELLNKVRANLYEQDRKDCYRRFPIIISDNSYFKTSQVDTTIPSATSYSQIIEAMRNAVYKLKQPTDIYNAYTKTVGSGATAKTYTLKTFTYRPAIFIRYSLYNAISVNYESGVKNLEKIAVDADIYVVSDLYTDASANSYMTATDPSSVTLVSDPTKLFIVAGREWVKIYRDFVKQTTFEDVRTTRIGRASDYLVYTSRMIPAIVFKTTPTEESLQAKGK